MPDDKTITKEKHPAGDSIPRSKGQRDHIAELVRSWLAENKPVPPLSLERLQSCCRQIMRTSGIDEKYLKFLVVVLNNELWRDTVAKIPYEKRLLLLPRCLRNQDTCTAALDELGLICNHCGSCLLDAFSTEAQRLGYSILIAEGSPVVMALIESGQIEAVIGVSCLGVLENVFPYMEAGAIPGIAVPLLNDGCKNTAVDEDWVWAAICENSESPSSAMNLQHLRTLVQGWFTPEEIKKLAAPADSDVEKIALDWLCLAGKRWRPFLTAAVFDALSDSPAAPAWLDVRKAAVAVECFHKASLIHDDIEDADLQRYGQKTLHAEHGIPIALNAGDYLLGLGYQLLSQTGVSPQQKSKMISLACTGHIHLCVGQGAELAFKRNPSLPTVKQVIDIFRDKTAPAFSVALRLGALLAGADELGEIFADFSESIGIAYQIRDDINDAFSSSSGGDIDNNRLSILPALAAEHANPADKKILTEFAARSQERPCLAEDISRIIADYNIELLARQMMQQYRSSALACIDEIRNMRLKTLLRRVVYKIFEKPAQMGCCDDYKNRDV